MATEKEDHWQVFRRLIAKTVTGGNLVTDAHLAALTMTHAARLATCDSDFRRFDGLRFISPLEASGKR